MTSEWTRFGSPEVFEIALRWADDPDPPERRPAGHGWSMGRIELAVAGENLTESVRQGDRQAVSGSWAAPGIEKRANAFAAYLLMPRDLVVRNLEHCARIDGEETRRLAALLRVNVSALVEHLFNIGLVDEASFLDRERRSRGGNRCGASALASVKDVLGGREPDEFTEQKIMAILVCRVAWMPGYRSDEEPAEGGGGYVVEGNVPHESLNFLPIDGTYYGFVHNHGNRINFDENDLGGQPVDEKIADVSVVFCAEDPKSGEFLVTGWYSDATVHRIPFGRPGNDDLGRSVYFKATKATLIGEVERCFRIPRAQDNPPSPFGGIGQSHIWYGLNRDQATAEAEAAAFRDSLNNYMASREAARQTPEQAVFESRKRRISERLERRGRYRHFIREKGYQCEACEWAIEEDEVKVWGSSFELHHLTPLQELQEGGFWEVGIEDFAVLCASCHRAIHRTEYVSDVESFAQNYLPGRQGDDA